MLARSSCKLFRDLERRLQHHGLVAPERGPKGVDGVRSINQIIA